MSRTIFNITFHIEKRDENSFIGSLLQEFIPKLQQATLISDALFTRIITDDNDDNNSYSLQLFFNSIDLYIQFVEGQFETLLQEFKRDFSERLIYFCTTLKEVDNGEV